MNSRSSELSKLSLEGLKSSSVIRKIFLLGQKRRLDFPQSETIDLSLGNPDLEPPQALQEALVHLVLHPQPGAHRYMDNAGYPDVRAALAKRLSQTEGLAIGPDNVFLTCGAAGALHILMRSILDPADEVVLLAPFFVEYSTYAAVHGARSVIVPMAECAPGERRNFVPDVSQIERFLTPKTKLVIINSPNNPSGCVYPESFYLELSLLLKKHRSKTGRHVHVIADEPYAKVCFQPAQHVSPLPFFDLGWLVRSHSKDLGLAGERIGYIAWPRGERDETILDALRASARALGFVNAPALMQRLLPSVFETQVDISIYEARAKSFCQILTRGGFHVVKPEGTFFALPETPRGFTDEEFCEAAAAHGVLVVPAAAFGAPGHFRVSLTQEQSAIERAAQILVEVLKSRN